ncbi:MAG: SpoIID/LytB domain-containing protein [Hormoscilla sp. SP5CHS1]|nr:SpoIID/LytB domain-containing protein [Hormoscilla sp. SP12CHS1]MBC6454886.1 SpoIID/LytB domain-containing protein [Hormoscilla sp. SP5CHS1]
MIFRRYFLFAQLGKHWWLPLLLMLNPALAAALELRVAIEEEVKQVQVGSSSKATVKNSAGQTLGELKAMSGFVAQHQYSTVALSKWQASQIWIEPADNGLVWIGDRWYRGRVLLVPSQSGLTAVNYVDIEHYLYSVLGGEMPPSWPLEALKAQAVAARSYALYQREKTANKIYDLGDTTAWQVYQGVEDEYISTQQAVNATAGQVLIHDGKIIEAVFHSSSGGHTENVEDIWTASLPYLRAVPDFDQNAPVFEWKKTFSGDILSSLISSVGNILSLTPERTTPHGRITTMKVIGDKGEKVVTGKELRKLLSLKSTLFTISPLGESADFSGTVDENSPPSSFQVVGRGFGHGLGLSQYGANALARRGYNYQQILLHYYTKTSLARIEVE